MKAIFRSVACCLIVASSTHAASPTRIIVLDNENLIEGEVTRVDGSYEIRRAAGGDLTLPARSVVAVVADRKAAFAIVSERANRRDADERLRLARWCVVNNLPDFALSEAQTAVRMRPGFSAAEQLVRSLQAVAVPASVADPAVLPVKAESPAKDTVTDVPAIDYNSESFPLFASRVNAVLMNACASCHASNDVKAFRLIRQGGRSGATKNMMSALAQVNPTEPDASPLLTKAVIAHGSAKEAPFKSRTHPAYQTLESWARIARAPEGTLQPETVEPRRLPELGPDKSSPGKPAGDSFGQDSQTIPPKPTKPTKSRADDEFDPAIFNGQVKPKK